MKIAIPTKNGNVDSHFGHCDYYTIYSVDHNTVVNEDTYQAPQGCGCKSDVAKELADMGVEILLAGNIGNGAVKKIGEAGIAVVKGCEGAITTLIIDYLDGKIEDKGDICHEHGDDCDTTEASAFTLVQ